MKLANLYLEYGYKENFPAKYRILAEANNSKKEKIADKWQKYFNTEDENEKISIIEDIIVQEYELRSKKAPYSIDFREFGRAYIVRARLNEPEIEDYLFDKYGRGQQ
jgi:hemerythrin superfamily protein